MTKRIIVVLMMLLLVSSCSEKGPAPQGNHSVVIEQSLKQLGLSDEISRILLEISGDGFEPISVEPSLIDGIVRAELEVPFGSDRVFQMSAFDSEGTMLFLGADTSDVIAGTLTEVFVLMTPQVPMLRIAPLFREILVGVQDTFDLMIYNIDSLFGVSFGIFFNESKIDIGSVLKGDFLDPERSELFLISESGHVAGGHFYLGNGEAQGESGSGKIVRFVFTANNPGRTSLRINKETATIIDWQGRKLPLEGNLYIQDGEINVIER